MDRPGYWLIWLLAPTLASVLLQQPALLAVVLVGLAGQRALPDPVVWLKTRQRVLQLEASVSLNPENAVARRDLAMLHLERRRPRRARSLLEEALRRHPEGSAEIAFLLGVAHLQSGDGLNARARLQEAIANDHRIRYGEAHLRYGDACRLLNENEAARAAYERFVAINSSSVEGLVRLAAVEKALGHADAAARHRAEARATFRDVPAFRRRGQWLWAVRAWSGL